MRDRHPFAVRIRVVGDPVSGAFYGWRLAGWAARRTTLHVALPARSPCGLIWAGRTEGARLVWEIPRQRHHGRTVTLELRPRTGLIAANPVTRVTRDLPCWPEHRTALRIAIVAGQHPGEDVGPRAAIAIREAAAPLRAEGIVVRVVPLANPSGRRLGHTRETARGIDPNRGWHQSGDDPDLEAIRTLVAEADFVLDLHGDEFSDKPYAVAPSPPGGEPVRRAVAAFLSAFSQHYPHPLRRPRAPGPGEDHPGILVNWLGARGVPGVMIELPMRHARTGAGCAWRRLQAAEAITVTALLHAMRALARNRQRKEWQP